MSYRYGDITAPFIAFEEPLSVQDRHFVLCATTGIRPQTDGYNGLAVVRTLECAQRSLVEGRRIALEELDDDVVRLPEASAETGVGLAPGLRPAGATQLSAL
jgi:hypothetical protein